MDPSTLKSSRRVLLEDEILYQECPKCHAPNSFACLNKEQRPLALKQGSTELVFHRERIYVALQEQMMTKFKGLNSADRTAVLYFAYILLCDSVSIKAQEMFKRDFSSEDIQRFFANKAVDELQRDNLLG